MDEKDIIEVLGGIKADSEQQFLTEVLRLVRKAQIKACLRAVEEMPDSQHPLLKGIINVQQVLDVKNAILKAKLTKEDFSD